MLPGPAGFEEPWPQRLMMANHTASALDAIEDARGDRNVLIGQRAAHDLHVDEHVVLGSDGAGHYTGDPSLVLRNDVTPALSSEAGAPSPLSDGRPSR
jgi:hypothetical protein